MLRLKNRLRPQNPAWFDYENEGDAEEDFSALTLAAKAANLQRPQPDLYSGWNTITPSGGR